MPLVNIHQKNPKDVSDDEFSNNWCKAFGCQDPMEDEDGNCVCNSPNCANYEKNINHIEDECGE